MFTAPYKSGPHSLPVILSKNFFLQSTPEHLVPSSPLIEGTIMYSPLSSLAARSVVDVNEPPKYEGLAGAGAHEPTNRPTREIGDRAHNLLKSPEL